MDDHPDLLAMDLRAAYLMTLWEAVIDLLFVAKKHAVLVWAEMEPVIEALLDAFDASLIRSSNHEWPLPETPEGR